MTHDNAKDGVPVMIHVPTAVRFSDLKLQRRSDGQVSFDWAPIAAICSASGLDLDDLRNGPEDDVSALIVAWYDRHRKAGGPRDAVAEDLLAETILEQSRGAPVSHRPGKA